MHRPFNLRRRTSYPWFGHAVIFVAKADGLMALSDQLESQLADIQTDSRRLLEAVLCDALAPALEKAV